MLRQYFICILLSQCFCVSAQQNLMYDKILKIENVALKNHEIRVYKNYSTSTGLELFRFYQDEKENWKAEFYQTVALGKNNDTKLKIRKSKLNSFKNPELIWSQISDTNVIHLPEIQQFQYKLTKKNKVYQIEDGEILSSTSEVTVGDGISYYTLVKNNLIQNEFEYSNPESYLENYPNVDELLSFKELLDLIRNEYKVFLNE